MSSEPERRVGLLGLGFNLGERRTHLQAALDALPTVGIEVLVSSSLYDTVPVGEGTRRAELPQRLPAHPHRACTAGAARRGEEH